LALLEELFSLKLTEIPQMDGKPAGLTEGKASDPSPLQRDTVANDAKVLSSAR
jgi:hypothetical protein